MTFCGGGSQVLWKWNGRLRVPDALQRSCVAAQSRDPGATRPVDPWAPALQRTAKTRCAASGARDRSTLDVISVKAGNNGGD
ncbi:hypothetical protein TM102_55510 [Bradyrhizobium sp. TM102]|nr:hypothetical protein TM102_55510 [Bradyrhizobium sp. TM102]